MFLFGLVWFKRFRIVLLLITLEALYCANRLMSDFFNEEVFNAGAMKTFFYDQRLSDHLLSALSLFLECFAMLTFYSN